MSIIQLISLDAYCDECKRSFGEADDEPANAPGIGRWQVCARDARADMKTYGWTKERYFRGTRDYCPECSAKRKRRQPPMIAADSTL
jgi:hypothetical protein